MTTTLDTTHDPALRSWVASANGHPDFPIQNLPLGIVRPRGGGSGKHDEIGRPAVAIGDKILDLSSVLRTNLIRGAARRAIEAAGDGTLNGLLAHGAKARQALRARLSDLLSDGSPERTEVRRHLKNAADFDAQLPCAIGDYTDFYVGIHHATNVGRQFRPDNPLMPNYKWVPIGYHGRASSVVESGQPVRRPWGQTKPPDASEPGYRPSRRLDYELELGIWIGPGNPQGETIPIGRAAECIAGYCLLNDWSARDVQGWEYQPLGPFLAKSFATTISPWIVTPEALAPFRAAQPRRPAGDPAPLPYLSDAADAREGALAVELEALITTQALRDGGHPPHRIALSDARHMYWTAAQIVAHHASNGCNLRPGDLIGSGTISGPDPSGYGSLLETTNGGCEPIRLASGEERRFLEDGDEVILRARARREGFATIGFGECRGTIQPALAAAG